MELGPLWLPIYVAMNLIITLSNKAIMEAYDFHYPNTLALWHYFCTALGSLNLVQVFKTIEPAQLNGSAIQKLFLFSILFNVNIAVSTLSLDMVSMALHQIIRALGPLFTVLISFFLQNKRYPVGILASLLVIFLGVTFYALKGEINYSIIGVVLTVSGSALASLKGVLTNVFMVGPLRLHPFDLLQYMSGYAFLQMLVFVVISGELTEVVFHLQETADFKTIAVLVGNGVGAFMLNVVSFKANKATSPLAMNIGGITKQVLAIILAIVVFHSPVTPLSLVGVLITVVGIVWYARASFLLRHQLKLEAARAEIEAEEAARSGDSLSVSNSDASVSVVVK
eukprot:m.226265 g.226265  ORF g.226265 m.226265 type:complete len:339 (+) comp15167_c0_seq3:37-1053(+)